MNKAGPDESSVTRAIADLANRRRRVILLVADIVSRRSFELRHHPC
jgi:hypothetical protein